MDGDVGLGPEDLVAARLGPHGVAARHARGRPVRVQLVGLGVHVGLRHGVGGRGRAAARRVELQEAVGCLGIAGRRTQREAALGPGGGHGDRPAGADLAEHLVLGHLHVVEEDLGETGLAVDLGDRAHRHAGRVHGDEEVGQPAVALGLGVGAEDAEAPVGEGAAAGPCLLAVEDPVAVVRRVARRARADAGQVAAGVGLGPALAPDLVAGRHRREVARLLGLGPVLEHGGGEQEDAVLAHPLRGPGAVVLLLEDEPFEDPDVAPAVFDRPAHHRPAVLEEGVLPGAVGLEAFGGIERRQGAGRHVRGQPGPGLGAEGLLLGAEGQVHDAGNLPQRPRRCQRPGQAMPGRGWCCTRMRTKKPTTASTIALSEGTSPFVSNACPPCRTMTS